MKLVFWLYSTCDKHMQHDVTSVGWFSTSGQSSKFVTAESKKPCMSFFSVCLLQGSTGPASAERWALCPTPGWRYYDWMETTCPTNKYRQTGCCAWECSRVFTCNSDQEKQEYSKFTVWTWKFWLNKQKEDVLAVIGEVNFKVTEQTGITGLIDVLTNIEKALLFFNICHSLMSYKKPHLFSQRSNTDQNISHTSRPSHYIPASRSVRAQALPQRGCTSVCYYSIWATTYPRKSCAGIVLSCVSGDGERVRMVLHDGVKDPRWTTRPPGTCWPAGVCNPECNAANAMKIYAVDTKIKILTRHKNGVVIPDAFNDIVLEWERQHQCLEVFNTSTM